MNETGLKGVFRSLKYKNYRLYFIGQSASLIGTWMQRVALPWLVYRMTGSVFLLGVVGFAGQIPTFLLAPVAGVITDRFSRYRIMLVTQILAMVQAFILAILYFSGAIAVWHIIALGIFLGLINAFDVPARQSFVIEMVEDKSDLANAIALNSSMMNGARLVGPSIAGVLVATAGEGVCFLLNGVSFLVVVTAILMMSVKKKLPEQHRKHVLQSLKEGFNYTFGFPPSRDIILLLALSSLVAMPYTVLMPVFARDILHGGSHTFGFLMAAAGTGALIGGLYLASRKTVLGLGRVIMFAALIFGTGLMALSFCRSFELSLLLIMVAGCGMILQMASSNTILQTIVDDSKRGRVMSFYTMAFMGTAPFGSLIAGTMASRFGVSFTLAAGGAVCVLGSAVFATRLPVIRKLIRPVYAKMGIIEAVAEGVEAATELAVPPEE